MPEPPDDLHRPWSRRREWDVRVHGDLVRVYLHDAATVEGHDLYDDDPHIWANVWLDVEGARELALALQDAAREVKEDGSEDVD
jgi:hypothetical protein